ncbi:cyanate lyase [Arcobacter nitrofigilis DSM 7299]|uniref:Cyanate hydratase n=1 Tax=Arcobacter nitrofigilis (strain ATCC 33309 / DSM 7299 / CCUG 15893 / LMG 7604 / NCTC 12251 / CI) TaxID=572480 RepID=D5V5M8_ARCNC|nr:cyanase [Arcobacter nitrofigilis]ADG92064.1 cyanate lyase [Arcobacter nitrofigilis DSM 7299]
MNKVEMTEEIILAKKNLDISWEEIAAKVGLAPVFLTSACLGMNSLKEEYAKKLCEVLELSDEIAILLQEYPMKNWDKTIPNDPVIYRFYEIVGVYGETIKEIIGEKFGDGIMSAIDFSMDIDKEKNPAGDRVKITMNGKFLPYKSW